MNQHQHQLKLWMVAPTLLLAALPVQATPLAEAVAEAKNKEKLEISQKSAPNPEDGAESPFIERDLAAEIAATAETAPLSLQNAFSPESDVDTPAENPLHFDTTTLEIEGLTQNIPAPTFNTNPQQINPGRIPANPNSGVLVPNPQISIDGNPVTQNPNSNVVIPNAQVDINGIPSGVTPQVQPVAPAPPFLPRAVAPPVGDMTISTVNTAPTLIDLGTAARVDSLILKDAPVREVLSFLARSAGYNVVYTNQATGEGGGAGGAEPGAGLETISLDLENESVQDAFNYVLQVANLQANRRGRTILVGARLPQSAKDIISRTIRLNQVSSASAANFLTGQGAVTQIPIEEVEIITIGEGNAARTIERRTPSILALQAEEGTGALLLNGLSVVTDERLNSVTLVGTPRQVEIATSFLVQLDARRRQVAVNVKIVDVNLLNQDNFNTSFSFGIADSFFAVDGGTLAGGYGQFRPPTAAETSGSLTVRPTINNPFSDANTFLDLNSTTAIPGTEPGTILVTPTGVRRLEGRGALDFFNRVAGLSGDPFITGITDFELATDNVITLNADGTSNTTAGELGSAEAGLPSLFQFPRNFLASLQAQVISGNAKILTDPTLVIQEGQTANLALVQEVYRGTDIQSQTVGGATTVQEVQNIGQAGLELNLQVLRIDDNGFINLVVNPSVSAPTNTVNTPAGPITLVQERSLSSGEIRMRDGQTLILAGIIQETDRTTVSKVPILGDIPLLGALFRSTNRTNQRQEIIVLVTPQILDDTARFGDWGYTYTPGQDASQILRQQGIQVPRSR